MWRSIEEHVSRCDSCQRRKGNREFRAPLGEVEEPTVPFEVTSMDITGPYVTTPRKNKYLLTFVDHLTRYVEAYPIPDQTAETIARVYATQIVARHGTGSKLITDQGPAFMSGFFKETCKILGIRKVHTSSFHPQSNGLTERFHRSLHDGLSHYVNASNTNWDVQVPFFLMAYRATPNTVTGYSPFYLLHGREMLLPNSSDLRPKVTRLPLDQDQRLQNLKASLSLAYKTVKQANRKSHQNNKRLYDRKAKLRSFRPGDLVYLYNPAVKPGLSRKFHRSWSGPYKVTAKISDLNYEILDQKGKTQIIHANRIKPTLDASTWKPKANQRPKRKPRARTRADTDGELEEEVMLGPSPLLQATRQETVVEPVVPPDRTPHTPEASPQSLDTPVSERRDPTYIPSETPKSRRELQPTRAEPPVTRSRARIVPQDSVTNAN